MNNRRCVAAAVAICVIGLLLAALPATGARAAEPNPSEAKPLQRQAGNAAADGLLHAPFDAETAKATQQRWAKKLKREVVETNSIGMKLALIPPGEFLMGSPKNEPLRLSNEMQHRVRITKPFWMAVYAVTQSEYERMVGNNPSYFSSAAGGKASVAGIDTSRLPVEQDSWDGATEFCRKLTASERAAGRLAEGQKYALPSEAQWEYACRAGTTTPFNFGSVLNGTQANCNGRYPYGTREKGPTVLHTLPVGSFPPNAFGLYDMHGNVSQWCRDWYDKDYYANSPIADPPGPSTGFFRIVRGGDWLTDAVNCRSAYRSEDLPAGGRDYVGFRVVREP